MEMNKIKHLIYNQSKENLNEINKLLTPAKVSIIINYDDSTLIDLIKNLKEVETMEDLTSWLNFAISHNYYCGSVWNTIYNESRELEKITKKLIKNDDYLNYVVDYCDIKGDIFIFKDSSDLLKAEKEAGNNEIIQYVLNEYEELLTPEQLENIIYYDSKEVLYYIDEIYQIPKRLENYINYQNIINELTEESFYIEWKDGLIFDENKMR